MMNLRLKDRKGFTLIELLIVVAIIGIIAAIAIPNLLAAIQRGKQKRSMADIRTIGNVVETFNIDYNRYPLDASAVSTIATEVVPDYIQRLPTVDGWNRAIQYIAAGTQPQSYTIYSYGKDGDAESWTAGSTQYFEDDIVFSNGGFYQYPEGKQTTQ